MFATGLMAVSAVSSLAAPPNTPTIISPPNDGAIANSADVHMETDLFSDPIDGDTHLNSDWEISTITPSSLIWSNSAAVGPDKLHTHLGEGVFVNSHAGRTSLFYDTDYKLRVRHRDNNGEASTFAERLFHTAAASQLLPLLLEDAAGTPVPLWQDNSTVNVILPSAGTPPSVFLESTNSETIIEFRASDGVTNLVINPPPLSTDTIARLRIVAGSLAGSLALPASTIDFTDEHGDGHTIYLPAVSVTAPSNAVFWISANGSTYYGDASQAAPDFSNLARGTPVPWTVDQPGFQVDVVATGFQLPIGIAFVPNPGSETNSPYFYVAELYGSIKVVTRDGTVRDYASNLLNYTLTGNSFPGNDEQGVGGILVEPVSGDVLAALLHKVGGSNYPQVIRLHSTDGGLTASTTNIVLDINEVTQGAAHQISHLSIGPDGKLYVHNGDGQNSPNPAQDLNSWHGKILRLNLDGSAPTDNPHYNAGDGINSADYVFARGFRNPFGGDWRAFDSSHYEVENGPNTDRLARVSSGVNYLWNGSDSSMTNYAIYNWGGPTAPVHIQFIQSSRFGGSGFPNNKLDHAFVTESGATYATGQQATGKRISEFVLNGSGNLVSGPTSLIRYNGSGKATAAGMAAGPDGLYFTDLYKDSDTCGTCYTNRGANVLRIKFVGSADFVANVTGGQAPLAVQFTDTSNVPSPSTWLWDFGDGGTSTLQNPAHTYTVAGNFNVRLTVTGANGASVTQKNGYITTQDTLIAYDGFNYSAGSLANQSGGNGWGSVWYKCANSSISVAANSLSFTSSTPTLVLDTVGGQAQQGGTDGNNEHRRLPGFYGPNCGSPASQSVWISFTAREGGSHNDNGYAGISLFDSGGVYPAGDGCSTSELLFIGKRSGNTHTKWGMQRTSSTGLDSGVFTFDTTPRFIVLRLDFNGSGQWTCRMWIDKTLNSVPLDNETITGSPLIFTLNQCFDRIRIQAGGGSSINVDELRIGGTYDDVAPVTGSLSIAANPSGPVCTGTSVMFTATPANGGTTPSYQWKKNGNNVGSNSSTYTDGSLTNADVITCVMTQDASIPGRQGPATSNPITAAIGLAPSITGQPLDATTCSNSPATYTVITPGAALSHQWRKNASNLSNGGTISGATTATLTVTPTSTGDTVPAGNGYDCVVSSSLSCGSPVTSTRAALTVNPAPSITTQPTPQTVCGGSAGTFAVTASGISPSYAWRKRNAGWGAGGGWTLNAGGGGFFLSSSTGNNVSGPSSNGGEDINTSGKAWGMYNHGGGVTEALRALNAPLQVGQSFTIDMDNGNVNSGATLGFGLRNTANNNRLEVFFIGGSANYRVSDSSGSVDSGVGFTRTGIRCRMTLTGTDAYSMTIIRFAGTSTAVTNTITGTLSGTAGTVIDRLRFFYASGGGYNNGDNDLYFNSIGFDCRDDNAGNYSSWTAGSNLGHVPLANGGNISGADTTTLTISNVSSGDAGNYDVCVFNSCGVVTSTAVALTLDAPTITGQPQNQSVTAPAGTSFSATASGATGYQWRKGGVNLSNGGTISGSSSPTLSIASTQMGDDQASFDVVTTNSGGCSNISQVATLTVRPPLQPFGQYTSFSNTVGSSVFEARVYPDSGHIALVGPDLAGNPLANTISFPFPTVTIGGNSYLVGRVISSTTLGNGFQLVQALATTSVVAQLTFPYDGVMRYAVTDWGGLSPSATVVTAPSDSSEHFYGFGEKFNDFDQAGKKTHIITDDPPGTPKGDKSYKVAPWFMSTKGYGFHLDSSAESWFDMRAQFADRYVISNMFSTLKFNVVYGPKLTDVLTRYTGYTGRPQMSPPWAFAPWMSSDIWHDGGEIRYLITKYRERGIPGSVLVFDSPWEKAYNDFTWNTNQFQVGNTYEGTFYNGFTTIGDMMTFLRTNGFYVMCWMTPFINTSSNNEGIPGQNTGQAANYAEAVTSNYFVRASSGGPPLSVGWWKGTGSPIDFTNPNAVLWTQKQLSNLVAQSSSGGFKVIGGFKTDDGESGNPPGSYIPTTAVYFDGRTGVEMQNGYATEYHKAIWNVLGTNGLLFARSGFTGSHAYPGYWAGDNEPNFGNDNGLQSVVVAAQSAAISGYSTWASDVGGYQNSNASSTPTNLFIRWTQFGAFSPLMQMHRKVDQNNQYPWSYGGDALTNYQFYTKLHTALFPYIYSYATEASTNGLPIVRPVVLLNQNDPNVYGLKHNYYFGNELYIAPVVTNTATTRLVYLPQGKWLDFFTNVVYTGSQNIIWTNANQSQMPIFIREGAIIPMISTNVMTLCDSDYVANPNLTTMSTALEFLIYPTTNSSFTVYDGTSLNCQSNATVITATLTSLPRPILMRFFGPPPAGVERDGVRLPNVINAAAFAAATLGWRYDAPTGFVHVKFAHGGGSTQIRFGPDTVGDGISDSWRQTHFGGVTGDSCAACDPDGDGLNNSKEYLAGTDPKNSANLLRIAVAQPSGADFVVSFPTVVGMKYRVEKRDAMDTGSWTTLQDNIDGTGGIIPINDPGAATLPKRFYRVRLLPDTGP